MEDLPKSAEKKPYGDLNYLVNDYQVDKLPESNPLYTILHQYVSQRQIFTSQTKRNVAITVKKPSLEEFLAKFQACIKAVNKTYKDSKQQFEMDIKQFKNCDNEEEE